MHLRLFLLFIFFSPAFAAPKSLPDELVSAGRLLAEVGDPMAAAGLAAIALQRAHGVKGSARPLAHLARGLALYRAGRYRSAAVALGQAAHARTHVRDLAVFFQAEALFHDGAYTSARNVLKRFHKRFPTSMWRHRATLRHADCLVALNKHRQAIDLITKTLRRYPAFPHIAAATLTLAELEEARGRRRQAAKHLQTITLRWPGDPLAKLAKARLETLATLGVQPPTLSARVRFDRGYTLRKRKYFDAAMALFKGLVADAQVDARLRRKARHQIGRTLYQMERYPEALAQFEALMGDATNTRSRRLSTRWVGHTLEKLGRIDESAVALLTGRGNPEKPNAETLEKLAWLYFNGAKYKRAAEVFDQFAKKGGAGRTRFLRAWLQYKLGHYKTAAEAFRRLQNGRASRVRYAYWLARTLAHQGEIDRAVDTYKGVIEAKPMSYYAYQARARLKDLGHALPPAPTYPVADDLPVVLPTEPLGKLVERWGEDLPGLVEAWQLAAVGLDRAADLRLRRIYDEIRAYGRAGSRTRRYWRYRPEPYVDYRPEEKRRGEWGRRLNEKPRTSTQRRRRFLGKRKGKVFWGHMSAAFGALSDFHYVRRLRDRDDVLVDPPEVPENNPAWRRRYPRAFRALVERGAKARGVDPNFIWALMTVESTYNPWAISRVGARGLMQVMPHTGALVGEGVGWRGYGASLLFDPEVVVEMSTWYFHALLKKFNGQLALAIPSYNAGPHRVASWLIPKGHLPMDEFVEEIPYTEAREYTKKVLRYLAIYRRTYEGATGVEIGQVIDPKFGDNINF